MLIIIPIYSYIFHTTTMISHMASAEFLSFILLENSSSGKLFWRGYETRECLAIIIRAIYPRHTLAFRQDKRRSA
jgi:hypothetical protein